MRTYTKKPNLKICRRTRQIIGKYRYSILATSVILGLWGISAVASWNYFEQQKVAKVNYTEKQLAAIDEEIALLEAEKEAKQKLDEEAKTKKDTEEDAAKNVTPQPGANKEVVGCNDATTHTNPNSVDVLVNKKRCLVPLNFTPPDFVTSHGATISAKAVGEFNRMFDDAAAAGQPFNVSSSYRSYDNQVSTYNYWVSLNGQAGADTVSARPGYSEHQTGLAVDLGANGCNLNCFGGTSQYQWLQANAANYGFIQRYYSGYEGITGYAGEEWHYRYVGVAVAQDMRAKGIKTLEQYWGLEGGDYQ